MCINYFAGRRFCVGGPARMHVSLIFMAKTVGQVKTVGWDHWDENHQAHTILYCFVTVIVAYVQALTMDRANIGLTFHAAKLDRLSKFPANTKSGSDKKWREGILAGGLEMGWIEARPTPAQNLRRACP